MKVSRRNFIKIGGISALGAGILFSASKSVFAQSLIDQARSEADSLFSLNAKSFTKFIGQDFTFFYGESVFQGILSEVVSKTSKDKKKSSFLSNRRSVASDCFFLKFKVATPDLPQANYIANHRELGQFDLFLVPGETTLDSTTLIATINLL